MSWLIGQRTLKSPASISGVGLHTGTLVHLTLHPAPANTGIIFRRIDVQPVVEIPALTEYVGDTRFNTCLAKESVTISTVEHVMSALAGLGIDNAYVDLDAPEPPAMDGSAWPFVQALEQAGVSEQGIPKQFLKIKRAISVQEDDKYVRLTPADSAIFSVQIVYDHPAIVQTPQICRIDLAQSSYVDHISRARTFGFLSEYEWLKQHNLALGASLENTIVLNETSVVNPEPLRYPEEFVKHKILDAIGDLQLLGYNVLGEFSGYKSGHHLNHQLRLALLNDTTAWELVTYAIKPRHNSTTSLE